MNFNALRPGYFSVLALVIAVMLGAVATKSSANGNELAIGVCGIVDNTPGRPASEARIPNTLEADQSAIEYLWRTAHIDLSGAKRSVTLIKPPRYGRLKSVAGMANGYEYLPPSSTYTGKDSASFLVEIANYNVKVIYALRVRTSGVGDRPEDMAAICGPKGDMWKIQR